MKVGDVVRLTPKYPAELIIRRLSAHFALVQVVNQHEQASENPICGFNPHYEMLVRREDLEAV
jgi:hypothetical protein